MFSKIVDILEEIAPHKEPEEIYLYSKKILDVFKERLNDLPKIIVNAEEEYTDSWDGSSFLAPTRVSYLAIALRKHLTEENK